VSGDLHDGLDLRAELARIDRDRAETHKLMREAATLDAEQHKLMREAEKLRAEEHKLWREWQISLRCSHGTCHERATPQLS